MAQSVNQELIANLKPFIVRTVQRMNLSTGGVPPVPGTGTGNLLSSGAIPMDTGYIPTVAQGIATKKYIDDSIAALPIHPPATGGDGIVVDVATQVVSTRIAHHLGIEFVGGTVAVRLNENSGLKFAAKGLSIGTPLDVAVGSVQSVLLKGHSHKVISTADAINNAGQLLHSDKNGRLRLAGLTLINSLDFTEDAEIKTVADNLALRPLKDLYLEPGSGVIKLKSGVAISSTPWVPGKTGWGVTSNGDADFRLVNADELVVSLFRVDEKVVENNALLVTPGRGVLAKDWVIVGIGSSSKIIIEDSSHIFHAPVFNENDKLRIFTHDSVSGGIVWTSVWGTVRGYKNLADSTQEWTLDVTKANAAMVGKSIRAGAVFMNYGKSGSGFYEIQVGGFPGVGPTVDISTWSGTNPHDTNAIKVRVRDGQIANMPGVGPKSQYGTWIGGGASDGRIIMSNLQASIHDVPIEMFSGGKLALKLDASVPSIAVGIPIPLGLNTGGDGFWVGKNGTRYELRIGGGAATAWPQLVYSEHKLMFRTGSSHNTVIEFDASGNSMFTGLMKIMQHGEIQAGHTHFNHSGISIGTVTALSGMGDTNRLRYVHIAGSKVTPVAYIEATAPSATGHRVLRLEMAAPYNRTWLELRSHGGVWASDQGFYSLGVLHAELDLSVKRNTSLHGTTIMYGAADARSTMRVRGAFTTDRTAVIGGVLTANSNAVIKGTLAVTRGSTLSSTLLVAGAATLRSTLAVTSDTTLKRNLAVTGMIHSPQGLVLGSASGAVGAGQIILTKSSASAWGGPSISVRASGLTGLNSHAMSHTNAYYEIHSFSATSGGAWLGGAGKGRMGLMLRGSAQTADGTAALTSAAPLMLMGALYGTRPVGANMNLVVFQSGMSSGHGTTVAIIKNRGQFWSLGSSTIHSFDDEDDNALLRGYSLSKMNPIKKHWNEFIRSNVQRLEELNLIEGDFVNMNGMMELQTGAIWQINSRLAELEKLSITDMIKILFSRILRIG